MKRYWDSERIQNEGIEGGWVFGLQDFVRYGDLDTYNHVNNKVYHAWFENVRVDYFEFSGLVLAAPGEPKPVVRTATIEFIAPMFMGEDYVTLTKCSKLGRTSFDLEYAVVSKGTVRAKGDTRLVMVNSEGTKTVPVPELLRKVAIERDGAKT